MKKFVITAARTSDGVPVYLSEDGKWSVKLVDAHPFETEDDASQSLLTARSQEHIVCDPGLFKVKLEDDILVPLNTKSRLRFEGAEVLLARLGYFDIPESARRAASVSA